MLLRIVLFLLALTLSSHAWELYLSPKYEVWEEFDENGDSLLTEEGWLWAFGARGRYKALVFGGEIYKGTLFYDGQTQAGDPVQTDSIYGGFSFHLGVEKGFGVVAGSLIYRAEGWRRDIKSTRTAIGYKEDWFFHSLDAKISLEGKWNADIGFYGFGVYRYILGTKMQASIEGAPELEPKRGIAYELGAGLRWRNLGTELFYSHITFNRSDMKPVGGGYYIFQPKSTRNIYGSRIVLFF